MSTKRVVIQGDIALEGLLREGTGKGRVLVCHPHSLYGGSMNNNVVDSIDEGFHRQGYTTLRFNFRGVGGSQGEYDEGEGEIDDVLSAWEFLKRCCPDGGPSVLAGYSFGAWVSARATLRMTDVGVLFLVAYPFTFYDTRELSAFTGPVCFVGGTLDDIAPADKLLDFYKDLKNEKYLKVLPSDHFFGGFEKDIVEFIQEVFPLAESETHP